MTYYECNNIENRMVVDSEWPEYDCSDEPEYEEEYDAPYDYYED